MIECALVDGQNNILEHHVSSGTACPPDPVGKGWRWLPVVTEPKPALDPITEQHTGPFEEVLPTNVRRFWTVEPLTPAEIAENQRREAIKADNGRVDLLDRLKTATPGQIDTWVDANVTNIASARAVLKAIIKVIALDNRD